MAELAAITGGERNGAFVIEADIVLLGIADGTVHLQRGAHDVQGRACGSRLRGRYHGRMVLTGIEGREHAIHQRAVELDVDEAIDGAVLQHLKAADRLSELLPQLDVRDAEVERRGGEADE